MIYCVEDDDDIRELMVYSLKIAGYEAQGFEEGASFWQALKEKLPDIILLDIMLEGQNGVQILTELRQNKKTENIPVIMATAKGTEYDKVKSLDLGADDYLVKPFGMMEMISRIRAVLRRTKKPAEEKLLTYKDITISPLQYTAFKNSRKLDLTLKEFELLLLFMTTPNRVFTRQELLDKIWGQNFLGETRTVDVHIGTLRMKLGTDTRYIKTVRGVGYKLEESDD